MSTTWHYQIAPGLVFPAQWCPDGVNPPEQTIETDSSIYDDGVRAIFRERVTDEQVDRGPITVKIWLTDLLPDYGPYFYTVCMVKGAPCLFQTELYDKRHKLVVV